MPDAERLLDYRILAGVAMIAVALPIFYRGVTGGGGYFLAPIIVFPLSIVGGTLAGYGLVDTFLRWRSRVLRLGVAVLCGGLGVTGPVVVWYVYGPGDVSDLEWAYNLYGLALGGAVGLVLAREVVLAVERR